jgi:prepilin-type N-terminal cleavage/methylation domain-containing protein
MTTSHGRTSELRAFGRRTLGGSMRGHLLHDGRRAFTLIELLCVMVLLAVVAGAMALLLKETLQVERVQAEGFDRILQNNMLADQFRADVGQALGAPLDWWHYKADQRTLVLSMPDSSEVVYVLSEDKVLRSVFQNGEKTSERTLPVGGSQVKAEFDRPVQNPELLCLLLHITRGGTPLEGQTLTIAAALGGDRR